jgi:sortase A
MAARLVSVASALCLVVAGVQSGRGAWIYAKAEAAQVLLDRAWEHARSGEERPPPWPWADSWPVARIILPGSDHIVLAGANGRTLAFAPGHLDGSAAPGAAGACVIAGHRDTHFAELENLAPGDHVVLEVASGQRYAYRVTATAVVDEHDTEVLEPGATPTLVLVTCWPFHAITAGGPLRYVVRAEIVTR